jgi:L-threonylcarbamoyladenylate synthase
MTDRDLPRATLLLPVSPEGEPRQAIMTAAEILRAGRLVAFPTETVYGLGADAFNAPAVAAIFAAKGRPRSDPLIVHISDSEQLQDITTAVPPLARSLIEHFWPGPLTLILRRAERVPDIVAAGGPNLGVRMPNHPVALALLRAADTPVAAPSANRFMHTSPTTAEHVRADLDGRIDCILDGGPAQVGIESTVLDVLSCPARILRPGAVTREALLPFIPNIVGPEMKAAPRDLNTSAPPLPSPGQMERHYAPRTRLVVFDASGAQALAAVHDEARRLRARGERVGVLLAAGEEDAVADLDVEAAWLGPGDRLDLISRHLYAALRDLDQRELDVIITHTFGMSYLGLALWDRLRRAGGGRFKDVPQGTG